MSEVTISTHNSSKFNLAHNYRDEKMVAQENAKWAEKHPGELRIDPVGHYEVWHKEFLGPVYEKLFGQSIKEYNEKQIRHGTPERQIDNYLSYIRSRENQTKNAKHPAYEIIYSIGSKEHYIDKAVARKILKDITDTFSKRNPNLYIVSCVLHDDESGNMHCHLTYIPVATDCKKGPQVQNSLTAALKQQGIGVESSAKCTAQMQWERRENALLESKVQAYGYKVIHPQRGDKVEHLSDEEYKLVQSIKEKKEELEKLTSLPASNTVVKKAYLKDLQQRASLYDEYKEKIDEHNRDIQSAKDAMEAYSKAYSKLERDREELADRVNESANRKSNFLLKQVYQFIKEMGLWDKFQVWLKEQVQTIKDVMQQ